MTTPRFTDLNTEGYSDDALKLMNYLFEDRVRDYEHSHYGKLDPSDTFDGSVLDYIAEGVIEEVEPDADLKIFNNLCGPLDPIDDIDWQSSGDDAR
jgi:hypothetical protein